MRKKIKLFSTIAALCLSLALMAFGVYAAATVTYKVKGTVTYEIADVYVNIETKIFATSQKFTAEELATQAATFEGQALATTAGLTALNTNHTWEAVAADSGDVTYNSATTAEAPVDVQATLAYRTAGTENAEDKGVYTYFVVIELTNLSEEVLEVTIGDSYAAPANSVMYKFTDASKTIAAKASSGVLRVVFAMSLDDITVSISETTGVFEFPIVVEQA